MPYSLSRPATSRSLLGVDTYVCPVWFRNVQRMKKKPRTEEKLLTQEELLAEAAQTEIENMASLAKMIALEEETKAKAMATKKAYDGPLIKYRSFKDGDVSRVVRPALSIAQYIFARQERPSI